MTNPARIIAADDLPLPTRREEAWHYTDLRAILRGRTFEDVPAVLLVDTGDPRLVPAPGHLEIPAGFGGTNPVHLIWGAPKGTRTMPDFHLKIGAGAQLELLETLHGEGGSWQDGTLDITLEPGAQLVHSRLESASPGAMRTFLTRVTLGAGAVYRRVRGSAGADLSRDAVEVDLIGEAARADLSAATCLSGSDRDDVRFEIRHNAPCCASVQNVRTVLDGDSRGVFQGKTVVAQGAQKTDARQLSRALLLATGAEMDAKPELEIYADDVKCSHGATTGCLDENQLFYLQSRGLPECEARALLIEAFIGEILEKIPETIRPEFKGALKL